MSEFDDLKFKIDLIKKNIKKKKHKQIIILSGLHLKLVQNW